MDELLTASEILQLLENRGITISGQGSSLRCSPKHLVSTDVRDMITSNKQAILSLLVDRDSGCSEHWRSLLASGKSDMEVTDLDEALFLFAAGKLRSARDVESIWCHFAPFWKIRLPPPAWMEIEALRQSLMESVREDYLPKQLAIPMGSR